MTDQQITTLPPSRSFKEIDEETLQYIQSIITDVESKQGGDAAQTLSSAIESILAQSKTGGATTAATIEISPSGIPEYIGWRGLFFAGLATLLTANQLMRMPPSEGTEKTPSTVITPPYVSGEGKDIRKQQPSEEEEEN